MGALIQTKGTQRLAKLFNKRFNKNNIAETRKVVSSSKALKAAFADASLNLLRISDDFIAQYAVAGTWVGSSLEDVLYPATTLVVEEVPTGTDDQLKFTLPAGLAVPIEKDWAACSLELRKSIPRGTKVKATPTPSGNSLTVTFSQKVTAKKSERISFTKGNHERLVRRWRWYLENDLFPANSDAIRRAISAALADEDFQRIKFQTIEDAQRVVAVAQQLVDDNTDELTDEFDMNILLMTQSTTAIDRLDPQ